jgi:uncharacterized protein
MKWLVLLAVLAGFYLLWRHQRQGDRSRPGASESSSARTGGPATPTASPTPQEMVRCPACGLHLPREDALADAQGRLFCSAQHRDLPAP